MVRRLRSSALMRKPHLFFIAFAFFACAGTALAGNGPVSAGRVSLLKRVIQTGYSRSANETLAHLAEHQTHGTLREETHNDLGKPLTTLVGSSSQTIRQKGSEVQLTDTTILNLHGDQLSTSQTTRRDTVELRVLPSISNFRPMNSTPTDLKIPTWATTSVGFVFVPQGSSPEA